MTPTKRWPVAGLNREWVEVSARTALAALVSLLAARLLKLPEAYWAPITAVVIMQSTLGAALKVSGQRLAGTALGAAAGALLSAYFGASVVAFTLGVFVVGLLSVVLHVDRSAYRFAGITVAIVMLVLHAAAAWVVGLHRFIEVSVGILIGLLLTAVWLERNAGRALGPSYRSRGRDFFSSDEAGGAGVGQVQPRPLNENQQAILKLDDVKKVNKQPDDPGGKTGEVEPA